MNYIWLNGVRTLDDELVHQPTLYTTQRTPTRRRGYTDHFPLTTAGALVETRSRVWPWARARVYREGGLCIHVARHETEGTHPHVRSASTEV